MVVSKSAKASIHYSNVQLQYLSGYFKYVKINKPRFSVSSQRFMIAIPQRFVTAVNYPLKQQRSLIISYHIYIEINFFCKLSLLKNSLKRISFRSCLKRLESDIFFGWSGHRLDTYDVSLVLLTICH